MTKRKSSPSTPPIPRLPGDTETLSQTLKSLIVRPSSSSPAVASTSSKSFKLPDDWVVDRRQRARSNQVDKYYFEPGTGRMFRSLLSIQRYLDQETKETLPSVAANNRLVPYTFRGSPSFKLPNGWVIEEKTRYNGRIDKYYIEPGTGQRFRSRVSVERYLAGWEEYCPHKAPKTSGLQEKKQSSGEEAENPMFDFTSPPPKVKWVLTAPVGNMWSPFIADSEVPEFIKQKWSEILVSSVRNESQ
ncbi:methyl-CpG-binding domain-containing protein 7-like isoform X2 [Tripterygium wilfordii]|uniref:methyl-CpG-binding domain-containing protein 7-like isoform X2 n=1 Tax=Tripterygium wilfordii TaxID=458696 RepID=UPI0018F7F7E3|nr:methyl-CpG-binding domain-containing protein 7-like isoform X2 [Tripterygium wilfordii]